MKKRAAIVVLFLLVAVALTFVACDKKLPDATLSVKSPYDKQTLTLTPEQAADYDFTTLFSLKGEKENYPVLPEYLDLSNFSATDGGYVLCNYKDNQVRLNVEIKKVNYQLILSKKYLTVFKNDALTHDYLSYFKAFADGVETPITSNMITSDVKDEIGTYKYTVNFYGVEETLQISVEHNVEIIPYSSGVNIEDYLLDSYDFTKLFILKVDGVSQPVLPEYIDSSELDNGDSGTLYCSYGGVIKTVSVKVIVNDYDLTLFAPSVTVHTSRAENYDYLSLFYATKNNQPFELTNERVTSNVKPQIGQYEFTVSLFKVEKTLTVNVTDVHQVEILLNYSDIEIDVRILEDYDFTRLFSVYVDNAAVEVVPQMVDASALTDAEVGKTYNVSCTYDNDGVLVTKNASVKVVENNLEITSRDVVTYPNSKPIDLTTLFTISNGGKEIPVTISMISGSIDYGKVGDNVITLSYGGITKTATVTVRRGVVINKTSDVITVKKGTSVSDYFFENDFEVIVNGIRITNIRQYIDLSAVNFNVIGDYNVTVSVPYSDKPAEGMAGAVLEVPEKQMSPLVYYEETIIYRVLENDYTLSVKENLLQIYVGETFDITRNLVATVNGVRQSFTTVKEYANPISCYVEAEQTVDVGKVGRHTVVVKVYVHGVDSDPVKVTYTVEVRSDAVVETHDVAVFKGSTVYAKDLFTIKRGNVFIPVEQTMLSGKIDSFNVGVYEIELTFEGVTYVAKAVVVDNSILGEYSTPMQTFATEEDEDGDGYVTEGIPARPIGGMTINSDGTMIIDGEKAVIVKGIDEKTLYVYRKGQYYYLHIIDGGIIVLDVDNAIQYPMKDNRRPLVYFSDKDWTIPSKNPRLIVNSASNHILLTQFNGYYTIEAFRVQSKKDFTFRRYGLKIQVVYIGNGDNIYDVTWGDVELNEGFGQTNGEEGVLSLSGEKYTFVMQGYVTGKIKNVKEVNEYAGLTFRNGNSALAVSSRGTVTYTDASGRKIFEISSAGTTATKSVVYNFLEKTILAFEIDATSKTGADWYCYKFIVDTENLTFSVVDKDKLYGLYEYDDKYFFLDGYGTGLASADTDSYSVTKLTYRLAGNEVLIDFINPLPNFEFGQNASFYLADTLNVLIAKEISTNGLIGKSFINKHVSDGAIIIFDLVEWLRPDNGAKSSIYDCITIKTKDGELLGAQKEKCVNLSSVSVTQSGVYQITVTVELDGAKYVAYYALQTVLPLDPIPSLVADYGSAVLNPNNKLSLDKYGIATFVDGGITYRGYAEYDGSGFVVRITSNGKTILIRGEEIAEGIIKVKTSGAVNMTDYFTTGNVTCSGNGNSLLYRISVGSSYTYLWRESKSSSAEEVVAEKLSSVLYNIKTSKGGVIVKITDWNDNTKGLQISDEFRGEYVKDGEKLVLDGFGAATLNGKSGSYVINSNKTVSVTTDVFAVYSIDKENNTFGAYDIVLDNELLEDKTYTATIKFDCNEDTYSAVTSFKFGADGTVKAVSVSEEHDSGENACPQDVYNPPYANKTGLVGTYSVKGNKVSVIVGNCTFTFEITDVISCDKLVCLFTSVDADAHGYFAAGTVFEIKA